MACLVNRNNQGKVISVTTPEGIPSELFQTINEIPFLGSPELSVKIFSNKYADSIVSTLDKDVEKYSSGEPKLFFEAPNGTVYDTLENAMLFSEPGDVSIGFKNKEEFSKIASFNTDASEKAKFTTSQIVAGILDPKRVLGEDGVNRLQGKGEFSETREVTAKLFQLNAITELGIGNVKILNDGIIDVEFASGVVIGEINGELEAIRLEDVPSLDKEYDNQAEILLMYNAYSGNLRPTQKEAKKKSKIPQSTLVTNLYSFLKSLGFSTTTLESYRKNFKTKFGQDPDVNALADISNRIIAFTEGKITEEQLSEEVAHIAIEAYSDQSSIVSALVSVEYTPEYAQHHDYYYKKYFGFHNSEEGRQQIKDTNPGITQAEIEQEIKDRAEDQTRKEILGKLLAKQFTTNFDTSNATEDQAYLIGLLKNIWDTVVKFFSSRAKQYHKKVLDDLNKKIAENVLGNNMDSFENDLAGNRSFYYNASSKDGISMERQLKIARKSLEDMFKGIGERVPRANELEKIYDGMTEIDTLTSVNVIVDIASNQLGILEVGVKEVEGKPDAIVSQADSNRYSILDGNIKPILNAINLEVEKELKKPQEESIFTTEANREIARKLVNSIDEINTRLGRVEPVMKADKNRLVESIWEKIFGRRVLTEEQRASERAKLEGGFKDLSFFGKLFGLATTSQNSIIQLMAYKVIEMRTKVNTQFKETINPLIKRLDELSKYQTNLIGRDKNGNRTYYFNGPIDFDARDKYEMAEKVKKVAELTDKEIKDVEAALKNYSFREVVGDVDKYQEFLKFAKELRKSMDEQMFKEEYYEEGDKRFTKVKVAGFTQETLRNLNSRAFDIYRTALNPNGTIDKSKLTEADRKALLNIRKDKEIIKSAYDNFSQVRDGLREVNVEDLTQKDIEQLKDFGITDLKGFKGVILMLDENRSLDSLEEASRTALDMRNLDLYYRQEKAEGRGQAIDEFTDQITEIEKTGSSYDWVIANATLTLSEAYYESVSTEESFGKKLKKYIDSIADTTEKEDLQIRFNQYQVATRKRAALLKQNRRLTNPIETDVKNMGKTQRAVLELDEDIKEYKRRLLKDLPEDFIKGGGGSSKQELNEDYAKLLKESPLTEYEFCLSHMPKSNKNRTEKFANQITALIKGKRTSVDSGFEKFFARMAEAGDMNIEVVEGEIQNKDQVIQQLINAYARENVGSYFKRFAPEGYAELLEAMKSGEVSMLDVMNKTQEVLDKYPVAQFIDINPDYSWTKDIANEAMINPLYKKGGYYRKPKKDWLNKAWFEKYGVSEDDFDAHGDDISKYTATKNKEEFELLQIMIKLRELELENDQESDKVNKWQLVQKSESSFEKLFTGENFTSFKAAKAAGKDIFKDIITNRPDELDYGSQVDGEDVFQRGSTVSVKTIPKYYLDKLEDPNMITENIIEAGILAYRQSLLYKERKIAERDLKALESKLSTQKFKNNGSSIKSRIFKSGEVTNYFQFGQEYLNHHLYGIQQTRSFKTQILGKEVDLTRLANAVQGFARFSNLAYNIYVDTTGATTGMLNKALDTYVGDYYHKTSSKRANSQFLSMSGAYLTEIGSVNKESKLNALLEEFDVVEQSDKFMESKYSKAGKLLKRSPFLMSKASNMTVAPRVLLSILNDYRLVDGQFRSYNEFKVLRGITTDVREDVKSLEAEWQSLEKKSLYDYLDISKNGLKPSAAFNALYPTEKAAKEAYADIKTQITAKSKQLIQNVDSVLNEYDQVAAQRDVITNSIMMHRGWFLVYLARRFKPRSYNVSAGQFEEGHYVTLWNAVKQIIGRGDKEKKFKEWHKELQGFEKRNIKRSAIETAILLGALALGEMILAADDDDDTWIEDFGRLIYLRTVSEVSSSQLIAMPGAVTEIVKSPFTAMSTYEMLNPIDYIREGWKSDEEYGFKGVRKLVKGTILRRYKQYGDIQEQIDAFRFFNAPTLWSLGPDTKDETVSWESQGNQKIN